MRFPSAIGKVMGQESSRRLTKRIDSSVFQSWLGFVARNPHMFSPKRLQKGPSINVLVFFFF